MGGGFFFLFTTHRVRLFESAVVDRNQTKLKLGILNQQSRTNITAAGERAITA